MKNHKILFFTGAGISAESGIQTFRDSKDGLWNNHRIEDVCTPLAWKKNPKLVLDFYNLRRKQCIEAIPNMAHNLIAKLQDVYDVAIVTQNVDDLHERAGVNKVTHLHGELLKSRSTKNASLIYDCLNDLNLGDTCELGSQLRPHIVWFGESLDDAKMYQAKKLAVQCDVCIVIGTSMQVYPANSIPNYLSEHTKLIVIDPDKIHVHTNQAIKGHYIQKTAVEGMKEVFYVLMNK